MGNWKEEPWNAYLEMMGEQGKVSWEKESFDNLSYMDQVAAGFAALHGQVNNGGFMQFFDNGYGFMLDRLIELSDNLNMDETHDLLKQVRSRLREYGIDPENFIQQEREISEDDYAALNTDLSHADCTFYSGLSEAIEARMDEVCRSERKEAQENAENSLRELLQQRLKDAVGRPYHFVSFDSSPAPFNNNGTYTLTATIYMDNDEEYEVEFHYSHGIHDAGFWVASFSWNTQGATRFSCEGLARHNTVLSIVQDAINESKQPLNDE